MEEELSINSRLDKVLREMGLSVEEISHAAGVPIGTLYNSMSGRVKSMRCDTLAAIIKAYPTINANYILTGEGEPIIKSLPVTDDVPTVYLKAGLVNIQIEEGVVLPHL